MTRLTTSSGVEVSIVGPATQRGPATETIRRRAGHLPNGQALRDSHVALTWEHLVQSIDALVDTRGSTLTSNGRVIVDWATTLLREADDFTNSVSALAREHDSIVHAAVSMTIAEHYAPIWLAKLRRHAPNAVVSLTIGNSSDVVRMVEDGRVDVGIIESPTLRSGLRQHCIGRDDLAVAVAPSHPWARTAGITTADLAGTDLLVREPGSGTRDTLVQALADRNLGLRAGLQLASNTALKSAAAAGIGPVVLSALVLAHEFESGALVRVPLLDLALTRPLTAVWAGGTVPTEAASLFLGAAGHGVRS